ncbi:phosphoserine phosphatase [Bacillus sp. V3-13]|uniref:PP2C family serine/threonine-protein phosphatase n=1 Tax=Bacillus sp. V3-13 TaxID=2053728 RepID=UPI000C7585D3|nr:PP2C family serine/threonine-protein phosphatase [Bacillus sp. V3-13]PLR77286.1 phosphoserine phosphatase [Bacillus sp. V3-13]
MNNSAKEKVEILAHQTAKEGRQECGDAYYYKETEEYFICVVADGLGSGKHAFEASSAVIAAVEQHHGDDVETLMNLCNKALLQKRGAAVSIFKVYFKTREFVYSSVGNIRFFLYSPSGKLTYPLPVTGYLSGRPQSFHTQRFLYEPSSKFLIHSDGLHLQGAKSLLKGFLPLELIANEIKSKYMTTSDDTTFIIGSLLQ